MFRTHGMTNTFDIFSCDAHAGTMPGEQKVESLRRWVACATPWQDSTHLSQAQASRAWEHAVPKHYWWQTCMRVCVCARACVQAMYVCVRLCSHSRNNVYTTITLEVLVCGVGLALRTGMAFGSQKLRSKLQTKLRQWLFPENNCSPNIYEGYRWYIYIYLFVLGSVVNI